MAKLRDQPLHDEPPKSCTISLMERLNRPMNAGIMCNADVKCTEALRLVILGLRATFKENMQSSISEIVYGEPLPVYGELLVPPAPRVESASFIQQLRYRMDKLRQIPAAHLPSPVTFMHSELQDSTYVFQGGTPYAASWTHHTERPEQSPCLHRENCCARQGVHCISRLIEACINIGRDSERHHG
jgi:hypothetical protein